MDKSTVLITGGAGFLGSHLIELLLQKFKGVNIRILDNFSSVLEENIKNIEKVELVRGDIRDIGDVRKATENIDYVFHLAAKPFIPDCYNNPEEFLITNINGTFNLIKAVLNQNIKAFVHMSTSEVYGSAQYIPIDEKHPTLPRSTYAASKLAAENIAFTMHKEHKFPLTIIRGFNFYGPRDSHPRIIPELITQFSCGKELNLGNINATRDFLFVKDVAEGLIKAALTEESRGEIINLATGIETHLKDLIKLVADEMGIKDYKINVKKDRLRPYDVDRLCGSNNKAKNILKWQPEVNLREGIKRTVEWYRKEKQWPFEKKK